MNTTAIVPGLMVVPPPPPPLPPVVHSTTAQSITDLNASTSLQATSMNLKEEFCRDMMRLFSHSILSDLTLVVGPKNNPTYFKVHKSVLAARCDYFYRYTSVCQS